jgi:hypothetical protein
MRPHLLVVFLCLLFLMGCELDEVTLTEPENTLVAEIYLEVGDGSDEVSAFLQWSLGSGGAPALADASIRLREEGGGILELVRASRGECLDPEILDDVEGECFLAPDLEDGRIRPGQHVEVDISLPDGRELTGGVTLPGTFDFLVPSDLDVCALPPGQQLELAWDPSEGAWAYAGETVLSGLREALGPQGVEVEEDTLSLLGLSIAETDTTLVFPAEFGVFDRFDLDREIALALQEGLPLGVQARVVVAAAERNYVNWVRGGNFNPSGAVRIPSLRGDGVGVLGGVVRRMIRIEGAFPREGLPGCLPES